MIYDENVVDMTLPYFIQLLIEYAFHPDHC